MKVKCIRKAEIITDDGTKIGVLKKNKIYNIKNNYILLDSTWIVKFIPYDSNRMKDFFIEIKKED